MDISTTTCLEGTLLDIKGVDLDKALLVALGYSSTEEKQLILSDIIATHGSYEGAGKHTMWMSDDTATVCPKCHGCGTLEISHGTGICDLCGGMGWI